MGSPVFENGSRRNLGICPHPGNSTQHPYTNQRSERRKGRMTPKDLLVKRQCQIRALAINNWAMGEFRVGGQLSLGQRERTG